MIRRLFLALAAVSVISCSVQDEEDDTSTGIPEGISGLVGMYTFQGVSFIDTVGNSRIVELFPVPRPETLWIDSVGNMAQSNTPGLFTHGWRTGCRALITEVETGEDGKSGRLHFVHPSTFDRATVNQFEINDSLLLLHRAWTDSICMPLYYGHSNSKMVIESWKKSGLR